MAETTRRSLARRNSVKSISKPDAMEIVLQEIALGAKLADATAKAGRTVETYRDWYKSDPAFKARVVALREARANVTDEQRTEIPDFPEFCREYLFEPLFPHQMRAWRVLKGEEPGELHSLMQYEPGNRKRVIMNFPPNHAKTNTFAVNYIVWRVHKNPGISIAVVSKSQGYAKKILTAVKMRLTSKKYQAMHLRFAPEGGWPAKGQEWSRNMIYVQGKYDGETEKEPTVEAVGLEGSIYGGRFDLVILDDVIDNENAHRFADQTDWVMTILDSRLPPSGGMMLILGTRLAPNDLYGNLRTLRDRFENQFFTYFAQPAVLDYDFDGDGHWQTLWPWELSPSPDDHGRTQRCVQCYAQPGDCDHGDIEWVRPRWQESELATKRFPLGERRWSLVWQQQQVPDDATFNARAVVASINRMRKPGVMKPTAAGSREGGMAGLYVIGGLDPATVGHTAIIINALDRFTEKRYILNGFNQANCSPALMRERVKHFTDEYGVNEWVIERNAFQRFLTQDPDLMQYLQARGVRRTEHYTGSDKKDPDFGVMSLSPLFDTCGYAPPNNQSAIWHRTPDKALIELPDERESAVISSLIGQLITWEPSGMAPTAKQDLVMALWFTEIAAQRILQHGRQKRTHLDNKYASRGALRTRSVVNLADWRAAQEA